MSVAIDGNTIAVGVRLDDSDGLTDTGSIYVYQFDGTNWVHRRIAPFSPEQSAELGRSVAISGNWLIGGAHLDNTVGGTDAGLAMILDLSNSAPINSVPSTQSVTQGQTLVFSSSNGNAISISDADSLNQQLRITLSVANGSLWLGNNTGLAVSGNNSSTVVLTGTANEINNALALGLFYSGNPNFSGTDSLTVLTSDLGRSGNSINTDSDVVTINVASSTNSPSATNLNQSRVYLDGATGVTFTNIVVSDPNAGDSITATLTLSNTATGSLTANHGATYNSTTGVWTITGSVAQVNTALANVALTSLLYAADKIAQTVGHYDAYFNKQAIDKSVLFKAPLPIGTGTGHQVFTEDANLVVARSKAEVLYLDPPYNSRQYSDAYHVLENIARWEKPEVFGVAQKMDRTSMKSKYSTRAAAETFDGLVKSARAELIVLSYSNTGSSRATRSNNVLTDEEIINSLASVGKVSIENIDFKEFSVGKTSRRHHQERLFVCQVGG
jgi:16S rRNA G966 N2-methylase RsmD